MSDYEKKKKIAMMAATYYILQQSGDCKPCKNHEHWLKIGKEMIMKNRTWIQSRGRFH